MLASSESQLRTYLGGAGGSDDSREEKLFTSSRVTGMSQFWADVVQKLPTYATYSTCSC